MSGTAGLGAPLSHGADILLVDILRRDADVDHGDLDLRMSHQMHERGQTDAGTDHVHGERMAESMGIGFGDAGSLTMMPEQGTEARRPAVSRVLCKRSPWLMFRAGYTGCTRAEGKALRRRNLSAGSAAGIRRDRAQLVPASSNPGDKA